MIWAEPWAACPWLQAHRQSRSWRTAACSNRRCLFETGRPGCLWARPPSRSSRRSPTQTIGVSPHSSAACVRLSTVSSVSPKKSRRSLWPTTPMRGTDGGKRRPGNLAGESALLGPGHVLRANANGGAVSGCDGRGKIGEGRRHQRPRSARKPQPRAGISRRRRWFRRGSCGALMSPAFFQSSNFWGIGQYASSIALITAGGALVVMIAAWICPSEVLMGSRRCWRPG